MPRSEEWMRASAIISFYCSWPIVVKNGLVWLELAVGAVVWATTQMEQEVGSVLLAWW